MLSVLLTACHAADPPPSAIQIDSSGVEIMHTPEPTWSEGEAAITFAAPRPGDSLLVHDFFSARLVLFGPEGQVQRTQPLPEIAGEPSNRWIPRGVFSDGAGGDGEQPDPRVDPRPSSGAANAGAGHRSRRCGGHGAGVRNGIRVDPDGRVWLEHYPVSGYSIGLWGVFGADGVYLGDMEVPRGFQLMEVGRGEVLGVWMGELDVPGVRVYAMGPDA